MVNNKMKEFINLLNKLLDETECDYNNEYKINIAKGKLISFIRKNLKRD